MLTNGDLLRAQADAMGFSGRTLEQVKAGLARAKRTGADIALARVMLRFGRMTDEARAWVAKEYPQ